MNKREKDYWHSRMNAVIDDNVREKEVARIYSSQYRKIEKKILNLYDKAVSGSVQRSDLYKLKHYQDVLSSIENQNKEIKKNLKAETLKTLRGAYKGAFKEVSDMLDTSDKLTEQRDEMLSGVLKTKWSGDNWSRRIWKNTDYLSGRIKADVVTSIVSGASRDTLVKTLMDDYNAGFNDADRLIRTETAHCVNQAQLDIYKSDGIEYVEWSAGKDERMCKVCGRLHGKRFKISEAPTLAHPRCRCTLIPVIPDNWTADKKPKPVDKSSESGIIRNNNNRPTASTSNLIINGKGQGESLDISNATQGANPKFSSGGQYTVNCQRCVQAYEFRRRGFDVEALPAQYRKDKIIWGNECFIDVNGNIPQFQFYQSKNDIVRELKNAPDNARYIIYVQWQKGGAHVFIAEKENGIIKCVDPQNGDMNVVHYFSKGRANNFGFLRVDDKKLTGDMDIINSTMR